MARYTADMIANGRARVTMPALLLGAALLVACGRGPSTVKARANQRPSTAVSSLAAAASEAPVPGKRALLPPLANVSWVEQLPLEDGRLAYVMPPVGAREPRPLMVGVHGAGDRADWDCGGWRLGASEYPFIVCPQGIKMDALRYGWDSPHTIELRVASALQAVRARFGEYIADGPTLYVAFSQGATLAGPVLLAERDRFPVVVLGEGGYGLLRDAAFLRRLHENGTRRLMIVCGTPACFRTAKSVQPNVERAGIESILGGDPLSGHNLNLQMQTALHAVWPALVRDLPNWSGFPQYLAARAKP